LSWDKTLQLFIVICLKLFWCATNQQQQIVFIKFKKVKINYQQFVFFKAITRRRLVTSRRDTLLRFVPVYTYLHINTAAKGGYHSPPPCRTTVVVISHTHKNAGKRKTRWTVRTLYALSYNYTGYGKLYTLPHHVQLVGRNSSRMVGQVVGQLSDAHGTESRSPFHLVQTRYLRQTRTVHYDYIVVSPSEISCNTRQNV